MLNINLANLMKKVTLPSNGWPLGLLFLTEIFLIVDNDLIPWIGRADLEGWIELSPLNWTLWSHLIDVVTPRSSWTFNLYFLLLFFFIS
jgi:hypothetical protein